MYSNLIPFNFCAHALKFKLWRQMRYIPQALCVNPIVVPSLVKCHCPDYPAVRQRSKWVSRYGRERVGGYANEMLTDPATITNHQSDLIS